MFIRNYHRCCAGLSPDFLYNRASSSAITLLGHHWLQSMAAETAILPPPSSPISPILRSFATTVPNVYGSGNERIKKQKAAPPPPPSPLVRSAYE